MKDRKNQVARQFSMLERRTVNYTGR